MKANRPLYMFLLVLALAIPALPGSAQVRYLAFNFCLDVKDGVLAEGSPVQIYTCNGTQAQQWYDEDRGNRQHYIHLYANRGLCLDVRGGVGANGTPVQLYRCNGTASQIWYPSYSSGGFITWKVTLAGREFCLDVQGGVKADRTPVQIYQCNNTESQWWRPQ